MGHHNKPAMVIRRISHDSVSGVNHFGANRYQPARKSATTLHQFTQSGRLELKLLCGQRCKQTATDDECCEATNNRNSYRHSSYHFHDLILRSAASAIEKRSLMASRYRSCAARSPGKTLACGKKSFPRNRDPLCILNVAKNKPRPDFRFSESRLLSEVESAYEVSPKQNIPLATRLEHESNAFALLQLKVRLWLQVIGQSDQSWLKALTVESPLTLL